MMLLSEAAKAMQGKLLGADVEFTSVGTDSRSVTKGQLFVALKGDHFDGHDYVAQAIAQGAAAILVSNPNLGVTPAIVVDDTYQALGALAAYWRAKFAIPVVAITGSNGKTTVKEMITAILAAKAGGVDAIHATKGNLNNHIGLPLTLLKLRDSHQFSVLEMGMSHLGEIDYLTCIAKPNVALINNAGTAHIGEVGSRENIAKAKGEIFAGLGNDGVAIINADDVFADYWRDLNSDKKILSFGLKNKADISAEVKTSSDGRQQLQLKTPAGEIGFYLDLLGEHNVRNALAASAVAVALNVPLKFIAQGLKNFGGVMGRLTRLDGFNQALVIDDTYNANPDSMKVAIDVLAKQSGKKIMVMGDMGELGTNAPVLHAEIGAYAKQAGVEMLYTLGNHSLEAAKTFGANARSFDEVNALIENLKSNLQQGTTVLVKGSRFMKMERVVNAIVQHQIYTETH